MHLQMIVMKTHFTDFLTDVVLIYYIVLTKANFKHFFSNTNSVGIFYLLYSFKF